jgi:hypothetical protein
MTHVYSNVSERSVSSSKAGMKMEQAECSETLTYKI